MMNNVIDLGTIEFEKVIRKVEIKGKVFEVSAIASAENSITYLKNISSGMTPRAAFCTFAYAMHAEAQKKKPKATTCNIFNAMSDDEALRIMQTIVSTNTDAPKELWELDVRDIFERFEVYLRKYVNLTTREMVRTINNLVETMTKQIASSWTLGLAKFQHSLDDISAKMVSTMKSSIAGLEVAVAKYFDGRTALDPAMSEFGWGGFSAIPGHIIQYINARKSELTTSAVDDIMQDYYGYNGNEKLDSLINNWWKDPLFENRKPALLEAIECYKQNLNIASITLVTTQTEGVIKSFLYEHYNKEFNNVTSFQKLTDLLDTYADKDIKYFYDCSLDTLEVLRERFTKTFHLNILEETSNLSRHKIAHGQMYEKVSKADVLKTILYFDELNRLLNFLSKNLSD